MRYGPADRHGRRRASTYSPTRYLDIVPSRVGQRHGPWQRCWRRPQPPPLSVRGWCRFGVPATLGSSGSALPSWPAPWSSAAWSEPRYQHEVLVVRRKRSAVGTLRCTRRCVWPWVWLRGSRRAPTRPPEPSAPGGTQTSDTVGRSQVERHGPSVHRDPFMVIALRTGCRRSDPIGSTVRESPGSSSRCPSSVTPTKVSMCRRRHACGRSQATD